MNTKKGYQTKQTNNIKQTKANNTKQKQPKERLSNHSLCGYA
jgi:hypothetical protein